MVLELQTKRFHNPYYLLLRSLYKQIYVKIKTIIYSTLKLYGTIRSTTLIDHFFSLGLCLSYDRVLEITKELSDTQIKHYMNTNVFAPGPLKKNLFTV